MSDDATTVTESTDNEAGYDSVASEDLISQNDPKALIEQQKRKRKRQSLAGRRPKHRPESPAQNEATSRIPDEDDNDDDTLDELPDYLRRRREMFTRRQEKLREAGLRLPPTYEDIDFSDDDDIEHLQEKPGFTDLKATAPYKDISLSFSLGVIPASLAQWLREYQVSGVAFLHKLFVYQTGGILGDDMGLGKTIQVITFLTVAFGKTGDERDLKRMRKMRRSGAAWYPRILIVCPGTLFKNWQSELERWGYWHVDVYHGQSKEDSIQAAKAGRIEIMLTTYATYRLDKDIINLVEWDCVIADEFHMIKGRHSSTTKAMNEINALCRIGLTGTAIQNSYDELWTLLNWTNPGVFGPLYDWKKMISIPLKQGQSHAATVQELGRARQTAKQLTENLLPRFFLRRMKTLIAHQLPRKTDRVVFCPLTPKQADAYERFLDSEVIECIKYSSDPCDCGSGKKRGWCCHVEVRGEKWQSSVFPAVATLQKLANHLAMLIPRESDPRERQDKDLELLQDALPDEWLSIYKTKSWLTHFAKTEYCGKWKVLKRLLRFWHEAGDKVLVFSHSVRLLKMLRMLFQNTSYNVSFLDGSMSLEDRAKEVDTFNADPDQFVFLISTKAGGVGLNITSANKVVIFDPNWNPAYDLQAQDRAYRIGQIRDVEVFRLVSVGTIEEIVYARQIYKQQQANIGYTASTERRYFTGVQENKNQKGEIFGLANLFAYQGENIVLRDIVNKTNVAETRAGVAIASVDFTSSSLSQDAGAAGDGGADEDADALFGGPSDDESGAMSQLADMVANGDTGMSSLSKRQKAGSNKTRSKMDPVQAILAQAGVEYTHENSEVIGSSRVEARLSRRAEEEAAAASATAAGPAISTSSNRRNGLTYVQKAQEPVFRGESSDIEDKGAHAHDHDHDHGFDLDLDLDAMTRHQHQPRQDGPRGRGGRGGGGGGGGGGDNKRLHVHWRYNPPPQIVRRQFCTMARDFGFADPTTFALVVEGWTQAQRRACLDRFYGRRRRVLGLVRPGGKSGGDGGGQGGGRDEKAREGEGKGEEREGKGKEEKEGDDQEDVVITEVRNAEIVEEKEAVKGGNGGGAGAGAGSDGDGWVF